MLRAFGIRLGWVILTAGPGLGQSITLDGTLGPTRPGGGGTVSSIDGLLFTDSTAMNLF
ncbi:MAG: hypothetical protein HC771_09135 [Synechococcales cyanobacterium CRU_2_2]|nr:hypothetical protein [Synechococcales cyanobacterium CRU_2_2]